MDSLLKRIEQLEEAVRELRRAEPGDGVTRVPGNLTIPGDVFSVPWTGIGPTATYTGWSSYAGRTYQYKRVGNLVFVQVFVSGTSNATTTTFQLPWPVMTNVLWTGATGYLTNNNVNDTNVGMWRVQTGTPSTVEVYRTADMGTAWTASGTKSIRLNFWYEAQPL
jgi:hypothetical protein